MEDPGGRKEGRGTSKVTLKRTPEPRPGSRRAWTGSEQDQESQRKTAEKQPERGSAVLSENKVTNGDRYVDV